MKIKLLLFACYFSFLATNLQAKIKVDVTRTPSLTNASQQQHKLKMAISKKLELIERLLASKKYQQAINICRQILEHNPSATIEQRIASA